MSVGLMCDCPLPPMHGLTVADRGHTPRLDNRPGCPNYAADQKRGGRCDFCADADAIARAIRAVPEFIWLICPVCKRTTFAPLGTFCQFDEVDLVEMAP